MTLLLKVIGIALVTVVGVTFIRPYRPEYSVALLLAGGGIILILIFSAVESYFSILTGIFNDAGVSTEYFSVALKAVGIGYLTEFAADTAADSGQTSLVSKITLAGRTAILILALPVINDLIYLALRLVNK